MKGLLTRIYARHAGSGTSSTAPESTTSTQTPTTPPRDVRAENLAEDEKQWKAQEQTLQAARQKTEDLVKWGVASGTLLGKAVEAIDDRAKSGKVQEAIGLLKGLIGKIDAKYNPAKAWFDGAPNRKPTFDLLDQLENWDSVAAVPLINDKLGINGQVTKEEFGDAESSFQLFKPKVEQAHRTAREKREFQSAYNPIGKKYNEAKLVPNGISGDVDDLIKTMRTAYAAMVREYNAQRWVPAKDSLPAVENAVNAVVAAGRQNMAKIETDLKKRAIIPPDRLKRAERAVKRLSEEDQRKFESLVSQVGSEEETLQLKKALVAGRTVGELETFAAKIRGKDSTWMQNFLRVTGNSRGKGIKQQFVMSCQATMVQAVKAERDPIYALQLHEENGDITRVRSDETKPFAVEQRTLLESSYDPNFDPVDATLKSDAEHELSSFSAEDFQKVRNRYSIATTTFERNAILEAIVDGESADDIVTAGDNAVGQGRTGGQAVHLKGWSDSDPTGRGRSGRDLLNQQTQKTGLVYTTQMVSAADRSASVDEIAGHLKLGRPVPLSVGENEGELAHYILAVAFHEGPPKTFYIHDPGSGKTIPQTEHQLKNNQMTGWPRLNKFERPSYA